MHEDAARLLRDARCRAGLTQRELAGRAGTSQSVVARIERGLTSPGWETLAKLISATGFHLHSMLIEAPTLDSHMLDDVKRIIALSPEERLAEVRNVSAFLAAARRD